MIDPNIVRMSSDLVFPQAFIWAVPALSILIAAFRSRSIIELQMQQLYVLIFKGISCMLPQFEHDQTQTFGNCSCFSIGYNLWVMLIIDVIY